ncbi:hypothetical protein CVT26_001109 [Gymnopilus dilepis]|uniref:Uncharacterized protein n=1 Tax=Gymnopilus dilepis TaxID=231916 RepID=A0A409W7I8_9AGAR|nr:hypothetical protein CVT26_001109 [Gymnopilus dilepis]
MDWYPTFTALDCRNDPVTAEVVVSQSLLDTSSPSWTAQPPYLPAFTLNSSVDCLGFRDVTYPSFRTVTKLISSSMDVPLLPRSSPSQSTLQDYPFDVYAAPLTLYVRNPQTGTIMAPNISRSFGVAVNFEISLKQSFLLENQLYNLPLESKLQLVFQVERSKATKMFVVMVAITNWLAAGAFLIVFATALVYHSHEIYSEMFVVPIGTVFAFTSIRANFPGAPDGFGQLMTTLIKPLPANLVVENKGTTLGYTILLVTNQWAYSWLSQDMYSTLPFLVIMSICVMISSLSGKEFVIPKPKQDPSQANKSKEFSIRNLSDMSNKSHVSKAATNEITINSEINRDALQCQSFGSQEVLNRIQTI